MALGAGDVTSGVAGFLADVFEGAGPVAVIETGKLLRDGIDPPAGGFLVPAIGVEIGRRACKRYADNSGAFSGGAAVQFENLCRPYLDEVGYGSPPSIKRPFSGGQCEAFYQLTYEYNSITTAGETIEPPDREVRRVYGPVLDVRGQGFPEFQQIVYERPGGQINDVKSGSCAQGCYRNIRVVSLVREGGQPDSCGNPSPIVKPPGPSPVPLPPGPTPFNPSPDIDIDISVDIDVGPVTGPAIVFDIGTGPITVDLFPGGGGGGGGGGTGPSNPPGDVGQPGVPAAPGAGGTASGCAGPNQVLAGLRVDIIGTVTDANQYDPQVYRGACYVYMGTSQVLALIPEGVALRSGQFFFPPEDNLTCWEVRANFGFDLRTTPYYRALELSQV